MRSTERPHGTKPVPRFWWRWLLGVSAVACVGGIVLAFGLPLYAPALDAIYGFVFGPKSIATLTPADRVLLNVVIAIGGGLQAGVSAMIGFMACYPLRRGECWALAACVTGLLCWLVLDTGVTVWYSLSGYPQLWPKVVNDLGFVLMFGLPYAGLYRHCCGRKAPGGTESGAGTEKT